MFRQTQRKLLLFYSGWIGCILVVLAGVFYMLLSDSLAKSVTGQLEASANQISQYWLKFNPDEELRKMRLKRNPVMEKPGQAPSEPEASWKETYLTYDFLPYNHFFFLLSPSGEIRAHSLADDKLWTFFRSALPVKSGGGGREVTIGFSGNRSFTLDAIRQADGSTLAVGMEVTDNRRLLNRMKWVLSLAAFALLLLSAAIGYRFSASAMVPIQRSYRRQQDFVADASHEIRTPLSIIRASAEILEEEMDHMSPFHQRLVTGMKTELARMTGLVESLLTLARSDAEPSELNLRIFDFGLVARSAAEAFRPLAAARQVEVQARAASADPPGDLLFRGDEERLRQLLYILLDNAVKYNRPGGRVVLEYGTQAGSLTIRVSDTGIGIPPEDLPSVFERFYRVDRARSRSTGGSGLGLSIAVWIVRAHGGSIQAESRLGEGTAVIATLPVNGTD